MGESQEMRDKERQGYNSAVRQRNWKEGSKRHCKRGQIVRGEPEGGNIRDGREEKVSRRRKQCLCEQVLSTILLLNGK